MKKILIPLLILSASQIFAQQATSSLTQITTDLPLVQKKGGFRWNNIGSNSYSNKDINECKKYAISSFDVHGWLVVTIVDCQGHILATMLICASGDCGGGGGSSGGSSTPSGGSSGSSPSGSNTGAGTTTGGNTGTGSTTPSNTGNNTGGGVITIWANYPWVNTVPAPPPPMPTPTLGGGGNGGGVGTNYGNGLTPIEPAINIRDDEDESNNETDHKKVDLAKIFNCFNEISNTGAKFEVKLNIDLPKNDNPDKMFVGGNPGHVFITLKKTSSDGITSISQSIGFYPVNPIRNLLSLGSSPTKSYIVNDGNAGYEHEINASLKMDNLTITEFSSLINTAINKSKNDYNITDYNCASFALDIFNSIRMPSKKITSQIMYNQIPGIPPITVLFLQSPQGLYKTLQDLSSQNNPPPIELGVNVKTPTSHGECN